MGRRLSVWISVLALFGAACATSMAADTKEWTFLVYVNGNNSLDSFGAVNIKQMETVGSTNNVNVVVQWASEAAGNTRRLLVTKSTDPNQVTSPIVQTLGQLDMGSYQTLIDFVNWGVQNYPARHYFVDIWDHGNGWHRDASGRVTRDISYDDVSGNQITTVQFGQAMAAAAQTMGHKVDIVGTDACLMAMVEIGTELADSTNVLVASEQTEPGLGWPYDKLLARWTSKANLTGAEVTKILNDEYVKLYQTGSEASEVTLSSVDLTQLGGLNSAIGALGAHLTQLSAADREKVLTAVGSATKFDSDDYVDLGDFVAQLGSAGVVGAEVLGGVTQALATYVIDNKDTSGFSKATGVSIWIPSSLDTYSSYSTAYAGLKFQAATQWGNALQAILTPAL